MPTASDIVRARARERYLAKEAGFLPGTGMLASSPVAKFVGGVINRVAPPASRTRLAFSRSSDAAARHAQRTAKRRAAVTREVAIRRAGRGQLLDKIRDNVTSAAPKKKGLGLGKKLMIGGGLLGLGATMAGGASAGRERAKLPLAPPAQIPPGY